MEKTFSLCRIMPPHKHTTIFDWLVEKNIHTLEWPPKSPDLNHIENLFSLIKRSLGFFTFSSLTKMEKKIMELWENIPTFTCENLVNSMQIRIEELLIVKGGDIYY